jgi:hypothetical protein
VGMGRVVLQKMRGFELFGLYGGVCLGCTPSLQHESAQEALTYNDLAMVQRKSLLKRAIFQVHMWGGLACGSVRLSHRPDGERAGVSREILHWMSPTPQVAVTGSGGEP